MLTAGLSLNAQSSGFFGKKNLLSLSLKARSPIANSFVRLAGGNEGAYDLKNGLYTKPSDILDFGYNLSLSKAFSRKFGLTLNGGTDYYKVYLNSNPLKSKSINNGNLNRTLFQGHSLKARGTFVSGGLLFAIKEGILPFGLSNEFGMGVQFNKISKTDIRYEVIEETSIYNSETLETENNTEFIVYDENNIDDDIFNSVFRTYILYYKIKMVYPLSKSVHLNFGLNYAYNFSLFNSPDEIDFFDVDEVQSSINKTVSLSIVNIELGTSFSF